jgi:integrase
MLESVAKHSLMDGKLHLFQRERSTYWQCGTFLAGRYRRHSTKTDSLAEAKDIARDWYLTLHGKLRSGDIKDEKTFREAAAVFEREYEILTEGQRSERYIQTQKARLRVNLIPYFGAMPLSEITSGKVQEYRLSRRRMVKAKKSPAKTDAQTADEPAKPKAPKPLARNTVHQEIVALRQVLKNAMRHGWLDRLPDLTAPYKTSGKISHRAWFSPEEYRQFYTATRKRALKSAGTQWQWSAAQLHDYVLFMANTGLRPDEAARLEYRDIQIVDDLGTEERILEIQVRGKRGTGYCKSTRNAVRPFERLRKRNTPKGKSKPEPNARLFPMTHRQLFNAILTEEGLKKDREGNPRTAYSLRHTYICMRLMEGADIYQIAKNCRTSVEMIEKYYAAHIRTSLNAAAINVRRSKA